MINRRETMGLGVLGATGMVLGATGMVLDAATAASAVPSRATAVRLDRQVRHKTVDIDGLKIFYREAGDPRLPALLLLHGFPTSSYMFRNLMPALADTYHLIAPDYPGFGFSDFPPRDRFAYSFAAYADLIAAFIDALGLKRFGLYVQDYGAPVGLRLALKRPDAIRFLIVQNGNAYDEGLPSGWDGLKAHWRNPTASYRQELKSGFSADGIKGQYTGGLRDEQIELLDPELWTLDWSLLSRPGNLDLQVDLFGDYGTNVALYPQFHNYFRQHRPPTLIAWGQNDPVFTVAGARAFLRDLPQAELHLFDGSHFLLETHGPEVSELIRAFAKRIG